MGTQGYFISSLFLQSTAAVRPKPTSWAMGGADDPTSRPDP